MVNFTSIIITRVCLVARNRVKENELQPFPLFGKLKKLEGGDFPILESYFVCKLISTQFAMEIEILHVMLCECSINK